MVSKVKTCLVVLFAVILTACGGGGGDSSPQPITPNPTPAPAPTPPPVSQLSSKDFDSYSDTAAIAGLSSGDAMLQIGVLAKQLSEEGFQLRFDSDISCINGGLLVYSLIDSDNSDSVTSGDSIEASYRECEELSLNAVVDGKAVFFLTEAPTEDGAVFRVDLSDLEIDAQISIKGIANVVIDKTVEYETVSISSIDKLELFFQSSLALTFENLNVRKHENYIEAKYSINIDTIIRDETFDGTYKVSQNEEFSGYFYEFPNAGSLSIETAQDELIVASNFVVDSYSYDLTYKGNTTLSTWDSAVEGAFWSLGNQYRSGIEFRTDNFASAGVAGMVNNVISRNIGLNQPLIYRFTRPVFQINDDYGASFETQNWPYTQVPIRFEINGALVYAYPETQLDAGVEYWVPSFAVESANNNVAYADSLVFSTRDDIISKVITQTALYRYNDTPTLDASQTEANGPGDQVLEFLWEEVSSFGVVFDSPNSAITEFTVPQGIEEDLVLRVTITDSSGYSVYTDQIIYFAGESSTFLQYNSPPGDYIGAGQNRLFTEADGSFQVSSGGEPSAINYVGLWFDGGPDWWSLDIASAQDDTLQVGIYEGATRYPFQSPTTPGLDFSGSGRGCNQSSGAFEIKEISYDENGALDGIAINFSQSCENTGPTLTGLFHWNSQGVLNPK